MKKFSILFFAAMFMISCGYKAKTIELETEADSINYALGLLYSSNIGDSSDEAITEFLDAVKAGYDGEFDEMTPTELMGQNMGISSKFFETEGLVRQPQWTYNGEIFVQAIINTWLGDTTTLPAAQAQAILGREAPEGLQYEVVPLKKCPKAELAKVELNNYMDSINYAFAMLNASQWKMMLEKVDTVTPVENQLTVFLENVNKGLKLKVYSEETYFGGLQLGSRLKHMAEDTTGIQGFEGVQLNFDILFRGMINGAYDYDEMMSVEDANTYLNNLFLTRQFGDWKMENEKWLQDNAKKDSVKTTPSGLQYKVVREGKGDKPTPTDTVTVDYEGRLINDNIFDTSYGEDKQPISFPLNGVIPGWTEGLQLMTPGSEYIFYIPQELGYGERGAGEKINPYSTLIFRVELKAVKKAQPQVAQPAPENPDVQLQMIN